jgi:hypothetical protein
VLKKTRKPRQALDTSREDFGWQRELVSEQKQGGRTPRHDTGDAATHAVNDAG